jgi:hypothetical protein
METTKLGRCECQIGREPFHACGLALGQGDKQCRRDAVRLITEYNPWCEYKRVPMCEACASWHESKAGAR